MEKYFLCTNNNNQRISLKGMAVVCHMYYVDTVENYFDYLRSIPEEVALFIVTSDYRIKEFLEERLYRELDVLIKPTNRGRDISTLLIESRKIITKYEYLCFIHDKKPIAEYLSNDTDLWIENLWKNMIGDYQYIHNVRAFFDNNSQCGLLIPPQRFGKYFHDWEYSEWSEGDYQEIVKLMKTIGCEVEIAKDSEPISLGTTFWCRTKALKKLFNIDWEYDDFPEEPLQYDGTLNHAVERC